MIAFDQDRYLHHHQRQLRPRSSQSITASYLSVIFLILACHLLLVDCAPGFINLKKEAASQRCHHHRSTPRSTILSMMAQATEKPNTESLLSPILGSVAVSKTIEIHALTKAMEAKGEAVVSLCVGEPDFPPPQG